jgi:hypothetical protein
MTKQISPRCASTKTTHNNAQPSPKHVSTKHVPIITKYQPQQVHQPCTRTYSKITNKGPLATHHTIHKPKTKMSLLYSIKHVLTITNKDLSQCVIRYTNNTQTCINNVLQQICLKTFTTVDTIPPREHIPKLKNSCLYHVPQHH